MTGDETADELYRMLIEIGEQLDQLHAEGRLSMSRDPSNSEWRDIQAAVTAARTATQAVAWMDTRP